MFISSLPINGSVGANIEIGVSEVLGGTPGAVLFIGAGGLLDQDPAGLSFDSATNALSVGGSVVLNSLTTLAADGLEVNVAIGNFVFAAKGTTTGFVFQGVDPANPVINLLGVDSATAPALVVQGGATPGAAGHLQSWRRSDGGEGAYIDNAGNLVLKTAAGGGYAQIPEMSAPSAPAAGTIRVYSVTGPSASTGRLAYKDAAGTEQKILASTWLMGPYFWDLPLASDIIAAAAVTEDISFAANFSGSLVKALIGATAQAIFTVKKLTAGGVTSTIGTFTFAAGGAGSPQSAALATTGGVAQTATSGDLIYIESPAQDATLADVAVSLRALRQ